MPPRVDLALPARSGEAVRSRGGGGFRVGAAGPSARASAALGAGRWSERFPPPTWGGAGWGVDDNEPNGNHGGTARPCRATRATSSCPFSRRCSRLRPAAGRSTSSSTISARVTLHFTPTSSSWLTSRDLVRQDRTRRHRSGVFTSKAGLSTPRSASAPLPIPRLQATRNGALIDPAIYVQGKRHSFLGIFRNSFGTRASFRLYLPHRGGGHEVDEEALQRSVACWP